MGILEAVLVTFVMLSGNTTILHKSAPMDMADCLDIISEPQIDELSNIISFIDMQYTCAPSFALNLEDY